MVKPDSSTSENHFLDQLAKRYGTDKSTDHHGYTLVYETYLDKLKSKPMRILELGWGGHEDPDKGGASAQMWRDYFPNGEVTCIDLEAKTITDAHKRINFRQGSQADPDFIRQIGEEFGPFDLIVDDASHLSSLTIKSWQLLYPYLASGGLYVLEDTHAAYHDGYYGRNEANRDPKRDALRGPTMMGYFKRLADEVNFDSSKEGDWTLFPRRYWMGYDLEFVHFYYNLAICKKK